MCGSITTTPTQIPHSNCVFNFFFKGLRANVAWGQSQFQKLMVGRQSKSAEEDVELEELRYRWMLYKSKLKEAGDLKGLLKNKVKRGSL